MRMLMGHAGPVFSTSFNPDLTFLLSSSEDGTGMQGGLYSLSVHATVAYKMITLVFIQYMIHKVSKDDPLPIICFEINFKELFRSIFSTLYFFFQ